MKIDEVLEAHGIGIVKLNPPVVTPPTGIVTNGLVGYWNSKLMGSITGVWANIAPATAGQYGASLFQIGVTGDGVSFNGSTSHVQIPIPTELKSVTNATFEMRILSKGGYADLINQDGRELIWIGSSEFVLSGIFDSDKFRDHKTINTNTVKLLYLTITADLTTNRITVHLHDPANGTTVTDSYVTTIGTFASGDFVWLSRTQTPFNGSLDGIRMYNRVLTAEEIAQNRTIGANVGI